MGGSGGFGWSKPSDIAKEVRAAESEVIGEEFQTELAGFLSQLLARYNDRDSGLVNERISEAVGALSDVIEGNITQIFGGSVAKHTYVDGLSDIDCLLILDSPDALKNGPHTALEIIQKNLNGILKDAVEVSVGNLAVTVKYRDGMEIQLLPAVRQSEELKIPSSRDNTQWSAINPEKFHSGLTKYNAICDKKLIPTIKLAKAIIGLLPDAHQLSGYHVESLAIDAFKSYDGIKTPSIMLPHFFKHAKDRVLRPMTDSTGQSVHVDGYMGEANSSIRQNTSHILGRIAKRMDNSSAACSIAQWQAMFGQE